MENNQDKLRSEESRNKGGTCGLNHSSRAIGALMEGAGPGSADGWQWNGRSHVLLQGGGVDSGR